MEVWVGRRVGDFPGFALVLGLGAADTARGFLEEFIVARKEEKSGIGARPNDVSRSQN